MNKNWIKKPLKELCYKISDGLHGTPNYCANSEIYFINGNNLKNGKIIITQDTKRIKEKEFKNNYIDMNNNTLLMSINGTLGNMAFYNKEKVMLGKSAAYLNFKSDINKFYYYYFQLKGVKDYFYNVATGSTIKNLSLKSIQDFEVPVPGKNEWQSIFKILNLLDTKIELNNKINTELESMAKLIYEYWFIQFDFPDENGKPYKSSGGKMVFNEDFNRYIPDGWEVKKIDKVAKIKAGGDKPKVYSPIKSDLYSIPIYSNGIENEGLYGYTNEATIKNQSITISARGTIGYTVLRTKPFVPIIRLVVVTPNNPESTNYLYVYIKNIGFIKSGSVQQQLTVPLVSNLKILYPSIDVVKNFYKLTHTYTNIIETLKEQNQQLSSLRDWLLPMLMNGQVIVGE